MRTLNVTNIFNRVRVVIKHSARALVTGSWLLAGTALAAPANDDFANAIDLTGVGVGQTGTTTAGTQTGTNTGTVPTAATLQASEPEIVTTPNGTTNTVWFKWTCPADGNLTATTLGSTDPGAAEWDAVLGIYTGSAVNALTPLGASPQDGDVPETMTVAVTKGTTYSIQLAGWDSAEAANILLSWKLEPTMIRATAVTAQSNFGPRPPIRAIDGSGMPPNSPLTASSPCATGSGDNTMWLSNNTKSTWITFDLGSVQSIRGFHLWNYNEDGGRANRGVETAGIYVGTSMPANGASYASQGPAWGTLAESFTFTQAPGANGYTGEDYSFAAPVIGRYIQIYVTSGFAGADAYTGISEISFAPTAARILTFGTNVVGSVAGIDQNLKTITWTLPPGTTNLTNLTPTLTVSSGVSNPASGALLVLNGSNQATYTVTDTATSPTTENIYTLTVKAAKDLVWNVAGGGDWDFSTSNWFKQPSGPSTTFADADKVTFNNPAGGTINIPSIVTPGTTTIGTAAGDYTFSGAPLAGTGSLTMGGSGTLTLASANTYSGSTGVNGGTLVASGTGALGGSTSFTVAAGAILQLNGTTGAKKLWPEAQATLTGAGTVNVALGGQANVGLNFNMSAFTGILNLSGGMVAANSVYSPGFTSPPNGTINIGNNTTLYLGWQGTTYTTTVKLSGGTGNGEPYGVLRGDNATLNGAVILATNSTIGTAGGSLTINAVISDGGSGFGFTQVASGTVTLTAANTYTGPTTVNSGATLKCDTSGSLGGGALSINGMVNLNFAGTKTVASLTLGGVAMTAAGTYGSVASGANFPDDTYFTTGSTGTVTVTAGSNYDTWLSGFTFAPGADTTATGDPDGDGVTNQKEYAFGLNPTLGSSVNPITQQLDKVTGNFQYTRRATPAATGLTYTVLTSTNLVTWTTGSATETGFTTAGNIETVTVHVTAPAVDGKLFVRVKAAPAP